MLAGRNGSIPDATDHFIAPELFGKRRAADAGTATSSVALAKNELILQTGSDTF